jgi:hypothetical protein
MNSSSIRLALASLAALSMDIDSHPSKEKQPGAALKDLAVNAYAF